MEHPADQRRSELVEIVARALYETSPQYVDFERQTWEQLCVEDEERCVDDVVHERRHEAKAALDALTAAGYAKRSDTIEECAKVVNDLRGKEPDGDAFDEGWYSCAQEISVALGNLKEPQQ